MTTFVTIHPDRVREVIEERDQLRAAEREARTMAEEIFGYYQKRLGEVLSERDAARAEAAQCKEKAECWRSKVVWCFSEEEVPQYIQGKQGEHELCSEVTADEVNGLVKSLIASRARVALLEHELAAALLVMRNISAIVFNGQATREQPYRVYETIRAHLKPMLTKHAPHGISDAAQAGGHRAADQGAPRAAHRVPPRPERWKDRSRSYPGIAAAAAAWGAALRKEKDQ